MKPYNVSYVTHMGDGNKPARLSVAPVKPVDAIGTTDLTTRNPQFLIWRNDGYIYSSRTPVRLLRS